MRPLLKRTVRASEFKHGERIAPAGDVASGAGRHASLPAPAELALGQYLVNESLVRLAVQRLLDDTLRGVNRKAGEWFEAWQGAIYSHARVAELIAALRREGLRGVGQSSWGPAVFAVGEEDRLTDVQRRLIAARHIADDESHICAADNRTLGQRMAAE